MTPLRSFATLLLSALVTSCATQQTSTAVAYTGATVWDGTGAAAVMNATILVDGGRILGIGADVDVPGGATEIDLSGKYVIPGLIEAHGHVTGAWAPESVTDPQDRIRGDLELYARYGVTMVNSLGDGPDLIAVRDAASPTAGHARVMGSGAVIAGDDPAQARADALANADMGADFLKLRVDDNLGAGRKMAWEAVDAVMQVGRERNIPVATHLYYLEDAKRLIDMGTGMLAHSVRDVEVDQELIAALRESGICYVPTLVREVSTFVYRDRPDWFDDPFFLRHASSSEMERASQPDFMERNRSTSAEAYRMGLPRAQQNVKILHDAEIPIAMGTDAGPAARFPGFFEHEELVLMAEAGLTPEEILMSATSVAAGCLMQDDIGTLQTGKWADFLVMGENPLEDILATRSLERVFIGGTEVAVE